MWGIPVKLFFDKTDIPTSFDAGEPNFRQVIEVRIETHVLIQVVRGDVVMPHHLKVTLAVAHDYVGLALHQDPKSMRIVCKPGEEPVQQHQNYASAECREKSRRSIDGARKQGGKDNEQDGIERSLARE